VDNISELHQVSRFPLLGAHRTADCFDCHKSESLARFDVPGINCIDCHSPDYLGTTNPKHSEAGFSEDCSVCHPINAFQWAGAGFNHDFFALVQGMQYQSVLTAINREAILIQARNATHVTSRISFQLQIRIILHQVLQLPAYSVIL